jgi:hypothetical protein
VCCACTDDVYIGSAVLLAHAVACIALQLLCCKWSLWCETCLCVHTPSMDSQEFSVDHIRVCWKQRRAGQVFFLLSCASFHGAGQVALSNFDHAPWEDGAMACFVVEVGAAW